MRQDGGTSILIEGVKHFTVVANVTSREIQIDGSPLPMPWSPLNVVLPT
jgi:hypothetical protein